MTDDITLPPLPEPRTFERYDIVFAYTPEHMYSYAESAVRADRAARGEPVAWMACTIDMEEGHGDDCVLDLGRVSDCVYAIKHGTDARKHCGEWKPVTVYKGSLPAPPPPALPDAVREAMTLALGAMERYRAKRQDDRFDAEIEALREAMQMALDALVTAEAGLADIGDADREPGDDLAWCEARAAEALPKPRAAIAALRAALAGAAK